MNKQTVNFDYFDLEHELSGSIQLPAGVGRKILNDMLEAAKFKNGGQIKKQSEEKDIVVVGLADLPVFDLKNLTSAEIVALSNDKMSEEKYLAELFDEQINKQNSKKAESKQTVETKTPILSFLSSFFTQKGCDCEICLAFNPNKPRTGGFTGNCKMGVSTAGVAYAAEQELRENEVLMKNNLGVNPLIKGEPLKPFTQGMPAEAHQGVMLPKDEQPAVSSTHNMSANNPLIVMFNAPPQSGKDTCADAIVDYFKGVRKINFKDSLYERSATLLGLDLALWTAICQNNDLKDKPIMNVYLAGQKLTGKTPREVLIFAAEECIKPVFGNSIFAVDALNSIRQHMSQNRGGNIFVMPDCGFDYEADVIKGAFPNAKVVVVQIEREGHTFDNDSRNWVPCDHILYNRGLEALKKDVISLVSNLLIDLNVQTMAVK